MHIHTPVWIPLSTLYHAVRYKDGIYWDELAEIWDISRAAECRGNTIPRMQEALYFVSRI